MQTWLDQSPRTTRLKSCAVCAAYTYTMSWSAPELCWEDGGWEHAATNKYFARPATGSFMVPRNEGTRSRL